MREAHVLEWKRAFPFHSYHHHHVKPSRQHERCKVLYYSPHHLVLAVKHAESLRSTRGCYSEPRRSFLSVARSHSLGGSDGEAAKRV